MLTVMSSTILSRPLFFSLRMCVCCSQTFVSSDGTTLMMRTLPLPFVSTMFTCDKSVCVSLTSRNRSPALMPVPDRANGLPLNSTVCPSPAEVVPSAMGRFLYMNPDPEAPIQADKMTGLSNRSEHSERRFLSKDISSSVRPYRDRLRGEKLYHSLIALIRLFPLWDMTRSGNLYQLRSFDYLMYILSHCGGKHAVFLTPEDQRRMLDFPGTRRKSGFPQRKIVPDSHHRSHESGTFSVPVGPLNDGGSQQCRI